MDSLASLNIVPFLGLMNILEVKYMNMPEIYRTMLAILCDYNPLIQSNIVRTRRYLSVLLAREPDLAECLLNFMDEPQDTAQTMSKSSASNDEAPCSEKGDQPLLKQRTDLMAGQAELAIPLQENDAIIPPSVQCLHVATSSGTSNPVTSVFKKSTVSIQQPSAAEKSADFPVNIFQMTVSGETVTAGNQSDVSKCLSYHDRMTRFVPVINIQHKNIFPSEAAFSSTCSSTQPQEIHVLSGSLSSSSSSHSDLKQIAPRNVSELSEQKGTLSTSWNLENKLFAKTDSNFLQSSKCLQHPHMKGDRNCRVAQTQTFMVNSATASKHYKSITSRDICPAAKKSASVSANLYSAAMVTTSQPAAVTSSVCLSRLLGQPSVTCLPTGHFTDNRNCIIGGSKSALIEKHSSNATVLCGKVSSAAAKLRLLSTQAGSKIPASSVCSGYGNMTTPTLGSSLAHTSSERAVKSSTAIQFSSKSGETSKTRTLSQILPVPKPTSTTTSTAKKNSQKNDLASSDKQIQVGEKLISKKLKVMPDKKDKQETFSVSSQAAFTLPLSGKYTQNMEENQAVECFPCSGEKNQKQVAPEEISKQSDSVMPLNSTENHTQPAVSGGKAAQQNNKSLNNHLGTCNQKIQVVEVSVGAAHSLSAFPYIQQMVLPDGQISTIAHNASDSQTTLHQQTTNQGITSELKESLKGSSCERSIITDSQQIMRAGKVPPRKQTTRIVLPRSQVKLSVSIQTSSGKLSNTCDRKHIKAFCPSVATSSSSKEVFSGTNSSLKPSTKTTAENPKEIKLLGTESHSTLASKCPQSVAKGRGKRKRTVSGTKNLLSKKCSKENSIG